MGIPWRWCALLLLACVVCVMHAAPLLSPEQKLREAALAGDVPRARLLLDAWPDVNATDSNGNTALMFAACACGLASNEDGLQLLYLLLANGADPNLKNNQGETALMIASARGRLDVVALLVAHGAEARKLDLRGDTAITLAMQAGHREIAEYLRAQRR